MNLKVGDTLVYPHHGTVTVVEISQRTVKGVEKTYLTLQPEGDESLTIKVPAANLEALGVRDVVDEVGIENVFHVLTDPFEEETSNWSRRYKANVEKIKSNDIMKVAEVVRDLSRRSSDKGLSAGEKSQLTRARQLLASEIASSKGVSEDEALVLIDEVLATVENR